MAAAIEEAERLAAATVRSSIRKGCGSAIARSMAESMVGWID